MNRFIDVSFILILNKEQINQTLYLKEKELNKK